MLLYRCQARAWRDGHRDECARSAVETITTAHDGSVPSSSACCSRADDAPHRVELALARRIVRRLAQNRKDDAPPEDRRGDVLRATSLDARGVLLFGRRTGGSDQVPSALFDAAEATNKKCDAATTNCLAVARWVAAGRATSFCYSDDGLAGVAAVCSPIGALLNHACVPNCVAAYTGLRDDDCEGGGGVAAVRQHFVAARAIAPGDEVTHAYVDAADAPTERRRVFRDRYGFDCACRVCCRREGHPARAAAAAQRLLERAALEDDARTELGLLRDAQRALSAAGVPDDDPAAFAPLEAEAHCLLAMAAYDDATRAFEALAARREAYYAQPHPRVALDYVVLTDVAGLAGDGDLARTAHDRALHHLRRTKPPSSPLLRERLALDVGGVASRELQTRVER